MAVKVVEYDNRGSLRRALAGQDALVCALSRTCVTLQMALIDAAVAVGVKRFVPSEFGANLQNEHGQRLVNYQQKVMVQRYLEQVARRSRLWYTYIYVNVLLDWSIEAGIILNFKDRKIYLYDGGERQVSMSTIPGAARAVVGVLKNQLQTRNRAVYIQEALLSQKEILLYAKELTPGQQWVEEYVSLDDFEQQTSQQSQEALANVGVFHAGAMNSAFGKDFGNKFEILDNRLLGIPQMTPVEIRHLIQNLHRKHVKCTES